MSQTLHTSDYMSVIGEISEYKIGNGDGSVTIDGARLNLHFSIQVNGKMKTFTHFLELQVTEGPHPRLGKCYELKDYRVWYAIVETLWELWYPIGEYDSDTPLAMNFINSWIESCVEELEDPDVFRR